MTRHSDQNPLWLQGPRVRLETLSVGGKFLASDGKIYVIARWYKDRVPPDRHACPIVKELDTERETMFAGCAEGVVM